MKSIKKDDLHSLDEYLRLACVDLLITFMAELEHNRQQLPHKADKGAELKWMTKV